jgi:predicted O-linked N-acetylglucosamine transferase (SPINDLY family)
LDAALKLQPDMFNALVTRSSLLIEAGLYPEALADLRHLVQLRGDTEAMVLAANVLFAQACMCDWADWSHQSPQLSAVQPNQTVATAPLRWLVLTDNHEAHKTASARYAALICPPDDRLGPIGARAANDRIRVGYFSADFHDHATMRLMAELFELHERRHFEWYAFSFGPSTEDSLQLRARSAFDHFLDVQHLSPVETATLARELQIDIAVDLKGFTRDARAQIFALRAAPVQVNYIGYPGSMPTGFHDYIVADPVVIPDDLKIHYAEKVVRLPEGYQVNDRQRQVSARPFSRQECGLPEGAFVFVCFNAVHKILPDVFASWMRILKAVPGSVLWLFEGNKWAPENLRSQAKRLGVNPDRLVFAANLPNAEHMARLPLADLFLDTSPYNAHTTASDALWMGVPLITRIGQSFAARVAASLLTAVGLPELIAHTPEEYEALAISIAQDPARMEGLKQHLQAQRASAPLFDTARFARHMESAYVQMIQRWRNQLPPDHVDVAPLPA